jgi:hypothetical protein
MGANQSSQRQKQKRQGGRFNSVAHFSENRNENNRANKRGRGNRRAVRPMTITVQVIVLLERSFTP